MSYKKYDLSQVSENTKLAYLQSVVDYKNGECSPGACERATSSFFAEAEVKPKTAREILEEARAFATSGQIMDTYMDRLNLLVAINQALEVLP